MATITGSAKITGAPDGWKNAGFYVQACPARSKCSDGCKKGKAVAPKSASGHYALRLPPGTWKLAPYYYSEHGQIISDVPVRITTTSGQKLKRDLAVAYMIPAAAGTVGVTGAPANFNTEAYMGVQGCPTGRAGCRGGTEAYENISAGQPYSIDLSPGSWTVYAYYWPNDNSHMFTGHPVTITVTAGQTISRDLTVAYQGL